MSRAEYLDFREGFQDGFCGRRKAKGARAYLRGYRLGREARRLAATDSCFAA